MSKFSEFKESVVAHLELVIKTDMKGLRTKTDTMCRFPKRISIVAYDAEGNAITGLPRVIPFTEDAVTAIAEKWSKYPETQNICLECRIIGVTEDNFADYGKDAFGEPDEVITAFHTIYNKEDGFCWSVGV